jgi:hypothetical protein
LGLELGGDAWKAAVKKSIFESDVALVLIFSDAEAEDEYVCWRVTLALEHNIPVVPILVDQCLMPTRGPLSMLQSVHLVNDSDYFNLARVLLPIATKTPRCFISYARTDQVVASRLATDLRAHGIQAWRDEDDLSAGTPWDSEVERALRCSTHVLMITSPDS